jgi:hypothetical protein
MKRLSTLILIGLIIGAAPVLISGCVSAPPSYPASAPCVSFVGTWNTDVGPVEITQDGCDAIGTFPSPLRFRTIRGTVRGQRLEFDWEGPLGTGRGIVTMSETGDSFSGTFGYGNSVSGGTFSGTRGVWPGAK